LIAVNRNPMTSMTLAKPRILLVDDDTQIRRLLSELLVDDYACTEAGSAEEALTLLREIEFDIVLSDINLGGMSGLDLVPLILRDNPEAVVVMISGEQAIESAIEAMRAGAFDYIMKPLDLRHVEAAVKRALNHGRLRKERERYKEQLEDLLRERTAQVNRLAFYDPCTELPNRFLFEDRLSQTLAASDSDQTVAVLFITLDQFKKVNDTLGHNQGDHLLALTADRLKNLISERDTVARFGSDEFALLLTQVSDSTAVSDVMAGIVESLRSPFDVNGNEVFATLSVGVALFPQHGIDGHALLKNAGAALYRAKRAGGNTCMFYSPDMQERASQRFRLETGLRRALDNNEFVLRYQPRVCIDTQRITGVEALLRWEHPQLGTISPAEFIPLAEDTGLIIPIGEWVLRTACLQNREWQQRGLEPVRIAVNISARQFQQADIAKVVVTALDTAKISPQDLELELTESSIMNNADFAVKVLTELKQMGVEITVDDFGTGFSSLGYLKRLPLDALKIDQSFVRDATTDPDDAALVMAVVTLGHNMRLKVIAEGVETEEQLRFLHLLRCDEIQGYLFSRPVAASELAKMLKKNEPLKRGLRIVSG
jgi:diguanylate cyclase (GGDEF)-like protein